MTAREMHAQEVAMKAIDREELFILDVRNPSDFEEWKIEGRNFQLLNIPYFDLIDGVEEILDQIPSELEVLVVCAKEGSSIMVADMLAEQGRSVAYLKGGMKAWSEHLVPLKVGNLSGGGELYQFVRIGKGCLSYMAVSSGEAALFDVTRMTDVYLEFAQSVNADIKHVFDTHLHADHISGGRTIAEQTGAAYWLPPKDAGEVVYEYEPLEGGDVVMIGNTTIRMDALHSPGHTLGSTSIVLDDRYLLTGDILFIDSIGRPDLAGMAEDWVEDLRETLYGRYADLSHELIVLPAHYMVMDELNEDGTVARKLGELYRDNHGLNLSNETEFRDMVTKNLPPQPNSYQEIRHTNMGIITPDVDRQREMEIGPNRCAVR
ncbi:MBL fold metallo-hydrolase [Paenibacillus sp. JCM 10914]